MKKLVNNKMFFVIAILLIIAVGIVVYTNTDRIAVLLAPKKQAAKSRSENAKKADEQFQPTITDDTMLARRYFQEAVKLDPTDARTLGFLAGHIVAEGTIHKDEMLTREGYYMLLDAIKAWPEFNLFTAGFVMSRLPADSPRFREGSADEMLGLTKAGLK